MNIPPISPRAVRILLNLTAADVAACTGTPVTKVRRFEADACSIDGRTSERLASWYRGEWARMRDDRARAYLAVMGIIA